MWGGMMFNVGDWNVGMSVFCLSGLVGLILFIEEDIIYDWVFWVNFGLVLWWVVVYWDM